MRKTLIVIVVAICVFIAAIAIFSSSLPNPISTEGKIAVIPISGVITSGHGSFFVEAANSVEIVELLDEADRDPAYRAIVLEINSPGGSPVASDEIAQKIESINKTTVAWIGDIGASGGYWIASSADQIVAHPLSITCSIGASFGTFSEYSGLFSKVGVNTTTIKSGEYKDIGNPARPLTDDEQVLLQKMIDDTGFYFIEKVSESRNIPLPIMQDIADGSPCLGKDAYALGLVDELGNEEDAINLAAKLANVKKPKPVKLGKETEFLNELLGINLDKSFYAMGIGLGDSLKSENNVQLIS